MYDQGFRHTLLRVRELYTLNTGSAASWVGIVQAGCWFAITVRLPIGFICDAVQYLWKEKRERMGLLKRI